MTRHRSMRRQVLAAGASFALVFAVGVAGVAFSVTGGFGGGPSATHTVEATASMDWPTPAAPAPEVAYTVALELASPPPEPTFFVQTSGYYTADDLAGGPSGYDRYTSWRDTDVAREIARNRAMQPITYEPAEMAPPVEFAILGSPREERRSKPAPRYGFTNRHTLVRNANSDSSSLNPASANIAGKSSPR